MARWLMWAMVLLTVQGAWAGPTLREIRERYESKRQDVSLRMTSRRAELANLLGRDDAEKATVKAKIQEIIALEQERQDLMVDEFYEAKGALKPKQWEAYRRRVLRSLLNERRGQ